MMQDLLKLLNSLTTLIVIKQTILVQNPYRMNKPTNMTWFHLAGSKRPAVLNTGHVQT